MIRELIRCKISIFNNESQCIYEMFRKNTQKVSKKDAHVISSFRKKAGIKIVILIFFVKMELYQEENQNKRKYRQDCDVNMTGLP